MSPLIDFSIQYNRTRATLRHTLHAEIVGDTPVLTCSVGSFAPVRHWGIVIPLAPAYLEI